MKNIEQSNYIITYKHEFYIITSTQKYIIYIIIYNIYVITSTLKYI